MGTDEKVMTWIMDTYKYLYGEQQINCLGASTGKLISQGGIEGRTESTGLGAFYVTKELLKNDSYCQRYDIQPGIKGKSFIVQGFGNVGYNYAKFMCNEGAKLVGVIEQDTGIYNASGFNPDEVKLYKETHGTRQDLGPFPQAEIIETTDPSYIMRKKCDIFVPCASDGTLNMHNANHVRAKMVVEGANGPTTFRADQILQRRGVAVVPDILANVGGVTVSYFEWLKNLEHVSPGRMTKKHKER